MTYNVVTGHSGLSLYGRLKAAGVQLDSHESDLYALVTPESSEIVRAYAAEIGCTGFGLARTFVSQIDGRRWWDLPFMNEPFWTAKLGKS